MVSEEKLIMVMDYIRRFTEENGYTPSVREIAQECGIKSTATVHSYLERLQTRGFVSKANNKKRSMSIGKGAGTTVPLIGTVTAGQPIFAYENYEDYYSFPATEFKGEELFMLRVQGTSMIDAGIKDGDKISLSELKKKGLNDSIEHIDFMIGTPDLIVIGIGYDGKETTLFSDGDWVI